jgi:NAD(P)H dehydrogenase (quinone)
VILLKILLILAHPKKGSFNHSIAIHAIKKLENNGHEVIFHDLYAENFNPIIKHEEIPKNAELDPVIEQHCQEISSVDGIIIVHPNWWGMPPAILKGWVDRVIRPGVAYQFVDGDQGEGVPVGLLKSEKVVIFNTSNTPKEREMEVFGDPLENIWGKCIFGLCNIKNFTRKNYDVVITSKPEEREEWLKDVVTTINLQFPED